MQVFELALNLGWSQIVSKEMSFQLSLEGVVNENVLEMDFEPLCDGTTRRRSLADLRLLEGM